MGTSRWMEHELEVERARILRLSASKPVSYTHLTLPTNREV